VSYSLDINGVGISLNEENAEKIMLAAGIGTVVWTVDWSKVGIQHDHSYAIKPHIKGFVRHKTYDSKDLALEAVKTELQSRIDSLKKML
jgi:hypothetical protein